MYIFEKRTIYERFVRENGHYFSPILCFISQKYNCKAFRDMAKHHQNELLWHEIHEKFAKILPKHFQTQWCENQTRDLQNDSDSLFFV